MIIFFLSQTLAIVYIDFRSFDDLSNCDDDHYVFKFYSPGPITS